MIFSSICLWLKARSTSWNFPSPFFSLQLNHPPSLTNGQSKRAEAFSTWFDWLIKHREETEKKRFELIWIYYRYKLCAIMKQRKGALSAASIQIGLTIFFVHSFCLFVWRAVMDYWQQFVSFALQSGHFVGEMCNFSFDVFNYPALKMNFFF